MNAAQALRQELNAAQALRQELGAAQVLALAAVAVSSIVPPHLWASTFVAASWAFLLRLLSVSVNCEVAAIQRITN